MEKEFSMAQKHFKNITPKMVGEAIQHALEHGPKALETFDAMAKKALTEPQGVLILKNLAVKGILSDKVAEGIETLWLNPRRNEDKERNLYNLYNAATEYLTHQVEGERYAYARATNQSVLLTLVNATRKAETFTKLTMPLPQEKKTVVTASGPIIDV
jgi:hypothetical protein